MRNNILALMLVTCGASSVLAADTVATKDTRLVQAAKAGNSAAAIALIQKRIDPNVAEPDGTTALHWAVRSNDLSLVDRLIKAGAKANTENRYGVTPIFLACQNASGAVVERLIAAGVNANTTGPEGETALHTLSLIHI